MALVDRFGRKGLLFTSTLASGLCAFCLGTFFYIDENTCMENTLRADCVNSFSMEIVDSLKWMPVVSKITHIIYK